MCDTEREQAELDDQRQGESAVANAITTIPAAPCEPIHGDRRDSDV